MQRRAEGVEAGVAREQSQTVLDPPGPIHHLGVVVEDIQTAVEQYRRLGFSGGVITRVAEQNVDIAAMQAGTSWIEIMSPVEADSPIGRFLTSRGPGVHHIAYLVDDLAATLARLDASGVELIDRQPRRGLHDWLIAFVHPRSCAGVLTELVDRSSVGEGNMQ
jgi:methylmalonyl-CoA/ethylmalonyl-CoA epimerase